jgi:hypothetical protein
MGAMSARHVPLIALHKPLSLALTMVDNNGIGAAQVDNCGYYRIRLVVRLIRV